MNPGIEHLDDLAINFETIGNIDHTGEHPADFLGDRGLAVAGRAIKQDRAAGVDRRSDFLDKIRGNHQIGEGDVDGGPVDPLIGDALAPDALTVARQRHGNGTDIEALTHRILRPQLAFLAQGVAQFGHRLGAGGPQGAQQLAFLSFIEQLLDDARRQFEQIADHRGRLHPAPVHCLDQQVEQWGDTETGLGDRKWRRRRGVDDGLEIDRRQLAHGDQNLADPPAAHALKLQRRRQIRSGHQSMGDQHIPYEHDRIPANSTVLSQISRNTANVPLNE